MSDSHLDELGDLCQAAVDGGLDDAGQRRLNELVCSDDEACAFYVDYLEVHALLAWRHGAVEPLELPLAAKNMPQPGKRSYTPLLASAAALVMAITGAAFVMMWSGSTPWDATEQTPIAVVLADENVQWSGNVNHDGDHKLRPGRQRIDAGTAHIELTNGVLLAADGPCEFDISAADHLHLYAGKVHIYSPLATRGFKVTTPRGVQIVDLGTRFGVWVDDKQSVHVHLFDGRLRVNNREELKAGDAIVVDTSGNVISATTNDQLFPGLHRD